MQLILHQLRVIVKMITPTSFMARTYPHGMRFYNIKDGLFPHNHSSRDARSLLIVAIRSSIFLVEKEI